MGNNQNFGEARMCVGLRGCGIKATAEGLVVKCWGTKGSLPTLCSTKELWWQAVTFNYVGI